MMDPDGKKFGKGPKELTGAVDLISHYKLLPYHDFFCKRALPLSISETHYLHSVVGDTEIRKGEGMELNQLFENTSHLRETTTRIRPFDLDTLRQAFNLRETLPVELPSEEKGTPTISGKVKSELKDKERKHKKHKEKGREKDKDHKKQKHRHKDRNKDKDKDKDKEKKKDKSVHHDSGGSHSKKHDDKMCRSKYKNTSTPTLWDLSSGALCLFFMFDPWWTPSTECFAIFLSSGGISVIFPGGTSIVCRPSRILSAILHQQGVLM